MIIADSALNTSAISTIVGYLAQRTNVCAKVLDRAGNVVAINKRGLELLDIDAEQICGKVWTNFWEGENRQRAETAVAATFAGSPTTFVANFSDGRSHSTWEVELFPCDWDEGAVSRVVALSSPVAARDTVALAEHDRDIASAMRETLHAISNLATAATSAANILRRGVDEDRAQLLATSLDASGRAAAQAMEDLRALIKPMERPA